MASAQRADRTRRRDEAQRITDRGHATSGISHTRVAGLRAGSGANQLQQVLFLLRDVWALFRHVAKAAGTLGADGAKQRDAAGYQHGSVIRAKVLLGHIECTHPVRQAAVLKPGAKRSQDAQDQQIDRPQIQRGQVRQVWMLALSQSRSCPCSSDKAARWSRTLRHFGARREASPHASGGTPVRSIIYFTELFNNTKSGALGLVLPC